MIVTYPLVLSDILSIFINKINNLTTCDVECFIVKNKIYQTVCLIHIGLCSLYEFSVFSPFSILYYDSTVWNLKDCYFYADTIFGEMYMVPRNQMRISN